MSSLDTMWDEEDNQSQFSCPQSDMDRLPINVEQEEVMLKRKAIFLEEFLRNGGMEPRAIEDRVQILRERIASLEAELSQKGKQDAARRYIEHAPPSDFDAVNKVDFMDWLQGDQPVRGNQSQVTSQINPGIRIWELSPVDQTLHRSKRARILENERPPCLRCRVLKKRCDSLERCGHCPEQGFDNESDFWKILGCYREQLHGLFAILCPPFSRSTRRVILSPNGDTRVFNFSLVQSKVSGPKRRRILNLIHSQPDFARLDNGSWDDIDRRKALGISAAAVDEFTEEDAEEGISMSTEEHEACWAVLQLLSMDSIYLSSTRYNLFLLIRQGNQLSAVASDPWHLFRLAKCLLRQSVELYLLERLCAHMASGDHIEPLPFYPSSDASSNTLILVDIRNDMDRFLREIEAVCASRGKLTGSAQLDCLYALLVFGVVKSMLIDAYSIHEKYEEINPWNASVATSINSAYKAIVSVFCWASKTDAVLQTQLPLLGSSIMDTRALVEQDQWESRGIKGTKEFLLGLGSSSTLDSRYNGFLAQKFGSSSMMGAQNAIGHHPFNNGPVGRNNSTAHSITGISNWTVLSFARAEIALGQRTLNENPEAIESNQEPLSVHPESARSEGSASPSTGSFVFVGNDETLQGSSSRRHGGRKGALNAETSKRAREMRKIGSCWNCWTSRMACSEGIPCDRCQKVEGAYSRSCFRSPFGSFAKTLFPDSLESRCLDTLTSFMSDNIQEFNGKAEEVTVSWESGDTIVLQAAAFKATPKAEIRSEFVSQKGTPLGVESLPVGVPLSELPSLLEDCSSKLLEILRNPSFPSLFVDRRSSGISRVALPAIFAFFKVQTHPIIKDTLKLYLALITANRPILFEECPSTSLITKCRRATSETSQCSSRMLAYQLRWALRSLALNSVSTVLSHLEKVYRSRDKALWPIAFAATFVLLLAFEQMQILGSIHLDDPEDYCQSIENGPYTRILQSFHLRFRTQRQDSAGPNPFAPDAMGTCNSYLGVHGMELVGTLTNDILKKDGMLRERDTSLDLEGGFEAFARKNSGRLVARFLLSFLSPDFTFIDNLVR